MKVFAPGKLVLTGAYAVLEGSPAIVVATDRGAVADARGVAAHVTPEVRAALGDRPAPRVDASAMFDGERKLGLGASAAILVASLGLRLAEGGADLGAEASRAELFASARAAHAAAQGGGSGVDVAASVYGGTLRYRDGVPERVRLPRGLVVEVYAMATSALTRDLRGRVDAASGRDPHGHRAVMNDLCAVAEDASRAVAADDARAFLDAVRRTAHALARLGALADAPIVPATVADLGGHAGPDEAFCVSGAGGGDVAVFVGIRPASDVFVQRAADHGLRRLHVGFDQTGVRTVAEAARSAVAGLGAES